MTTVVFLSKPWGGGACCAGLSRGGGARPEPLVLGQHPSGRPASGVPARPFPLDSVSHIAFHSLPPWDLRGSEMP